MTEMTDDVAGLVERLRETLDEYDNCIPVCLEAAAMLESQAHELEAAKRQTVDIVFHEQQIAALTEKLEQYREALEEISCCDIDIATDEPVDPGIAVANVLETARVTLEEPKP